MTDMEQQIEGQSKKRKGTPLVAVMDEAIIVASREKISRCPLLLMSATLL